MVGDVGSRPGPDPDGDGAQPDQHAKGGDGRKTFFYSGMEAFEAALVDAVRQRPAGEPVLHAFRRFVLDRSGRLADEQLAEVIGHAARLVGASRALQGREREVAADTVDALAALIAEELGAGALMGVQRAIVAYVRAQVLAGRSAPTLAADVVAQAERAFARLEHGLGDVAGKPS